MESSADVIVIGAGAAGLFGASRAAGYGLKVVVLEKQKRPGLKILISGGGRCNFTNLSVSAKDFVSQNPDFCKSALARYQPADFIHLVEKHGVAYHEKHRGQLFCDESSKDILNLLLRECDTGGVHLVCNTTIEEVKKDNDLFQVRTSQGEWMAPNLVVATGGLSFAKLGATDFGYRLAAQFGHEVFQPLPALTPMLWGEKDLKTWGSLAGVSCPARLTLGKIREEDDLLFTHNGLSGPVILRLSLHWKEGEPFFVDFLPDRDLAQFLQDAKGQKALPKNFMTAYLPARLAETLCHQLDMTKPLNQTAASQIAAFAETVRRYPMAPVGLVGYEKAEVTAGGVDTRSISSQTMESSLCPGLYFIGEVLDVTGDLGGFNFQWAWASAFAAAEALVSDQTN